MNLPRRMVVPMADTTRIRPAARGDPPARSPVPVSAGTGGEQGYQRHGHRATQRSRSHRRGQAVSSDTSIYRGRQFVGAIMPTGGRFRAVDGDDREIGIYDRFRDASDAVLAKVLEGRR